MFPCGGEIVSFLRINANNINAINEHDMLFIGGGELLSNSDILKQITSNEIKIPYAFLSVGIGNDNDLVPFIDKLRPLFWSVRSRYGLNILRRLEIKNAFFLDDPIFSCPIEESGRMDRIALCLKRIHKSEEWISLMARGLDDLLSEGIAVDLVSLSNQDMHPIEYCKEQIFVSDCNDEILALQINSLMKNKAGIVTYRGDNPLEFLNILASYRSIVSERLHGILAAYHAQVPFKAISYHSKINKFINTYNLEEKLISDYPEDICNHIRELYKEARGGLKESA